MGILADPDLLFPGSALCANARRKTSQLDCFHGGKPGNCGGRIQRRIKECDLSIPAAITGGGTVHIGAHTDTQRSADGKKARTRLAIYRRTSTLVSHCRQARCRGARQRRIDRSLNERTRSGDHLGGERYNTPGICVRP